MGRPEFDIGLMFWEMPPGYPELLSGRENDVPGLGAVAIAFSSTERTHEMLDLLCGSFTVHTHQNVSDAFFVDFEIIDPALLC